MEHFTSVWAAAIDADGRTGVRSDSLFHTLQGRAVIILTKRFDAQGSIREFRFADFTKGSRAEKEACLHSDIAELVARFSRHTLDSETYAFYPTVPFDTDMYNAFWPISGEQGQLAIFNQHCSGIKLAPTSVFTHVKASILKRRSREIATNGVENARAWFVGQDRVPKDEKLLAFHDALNASGDVRSMDRLLSENILTYSFRPYMLSNVLLWKELLQQYARIGGGGTRLRPELIKAYDDSETIGFAMAHAPKDLNPTLSQFVSFCWYYPDNDMCTRGNSHVYTNQYPSENGMVNNINNILINNLSGLFERYPREVAKDMVFYVYAILCSQVYLDEFEGALFTVHQTDKRARVPITSNKAVFDRIASLGKRLAELEKAGYSPENHLGFDYEASIQSVPNGFRLANSLNPFDEENEELILTDGNTSIKIHCPVALQQLNISGYDVIKSVWLKFHSYAFTHCDFVREDMRQLLDFLNTLEEHTRIVASIDEVVREILHGQARQQLILPER